MSERFYDDSHPAVRGFLHRCDTTAEGLVLTHGAGSNCQSPLLAGLAESVGKAGFTILRCDLPFRQERQHGLPIGSAAKDQAGLAAAVRALRKLVTGRILLGGHSYGGRMASMLAAEDSSLIAGLLLLSYPLHPPRKPEQLRTAHFPKLRTPALFVHGTRDPFGSIEEMQAALRLIPSNTKLIALEGAGHELLKKANREQTFERIAQALLEFVRTSS